MSLPRPHCVACNKICFLCPGALAAMIQYEDYSGNNQRDNTALCSSTDMGFALGFDHNCRDRPRPFGRRSLDVVINHPEEVAHITNFYNLKSAS